ncbi:MAG: entericidin A/B family lipoprotein [Chromatiaceae bacterium]|nr:entericidin A/B family lipoprotein [Gammaproteobacteria bacterium]MCP5306370.1 entericidin A/B family lipoprotein [Chromatiaceae bacterium]MCP5311922.1 entericidin A/B family lipoprotein [Chromatiaceae bacterium]
MNTESLNHARLRAIALLVLVSVGSIGLGGCNTVAGIGEDVEAAGDAIEDKAEKEKGY